MGHLEVVGMMKSYVDLKKEISKLAVRKKKMAACIEFVGIITEMMSEHKIKPIVTGGLAIEIYTRSGYHIDDIDIMVKNSNLLKSILDKLELVMAGRYWYSEAIDVGVDIFSLDPKVSLDRLSRIKLISGREIYVIGFEDLIINRLNNYYQFNSVFDYEWAYRIYKIHKGSMDIDYLLEKSAELNDGAVEMISKW